MTSLATKPVIAWLLLALLLLPTGCQPAEPPEEETIGLSLFGLNYTDVPVGVFYVNGSWGGSSSPYGAGLKTAGSVGLPAKWRPGITVTVKWRNDLMWEKDRESLVTSVVEIPPYGKIYSGYLLVAFLPGGVVKAYASGVGPGHADAPGGLENPGQYCIKQPGCIEWYDSGKPPREGHY